MRRRVQLPSFTPEELFQVPAESWNALIRWLAANDIASARVAAPRSGGAAWATRVRWDGERRSWVARLRSGIVNWEEAVVRVTDRDGTSRDVPLSEGPDIPLTRFRPEPGPPPWFTRRFAFRPPLEFQGNLEFGGGFVRDTVAEAAARARGGWRTLWATSIFLTIRRSRTTLDFRPDGRVFQDIVLVPDAPARVGTDASPPDAEIPEPMAQIRDGQRDPGISALAVATVWLLSPPGTTADEEPDWRWTPFVEQHLHYHLRHRVRAPETPPAPLELSAGFRGIGSDIINGMIQDLNRQDSVVAARMTDHTVQGRWWSV